MQRKRLKICAMLLSAAIGSALAVAAEMREDHNPLADNLIPLDKIWGYRLPGTIQVQTLEPSSIDKPLSWLGEHCSWAKLYGMLSTPPKESAGPALLVRGSGSEALKNAVEVFANKDKPRTQKPEVPAETEMSALIFCYLSGRYMHLVSVHKSERDRETGTEQFLKIEFRMQAHREFVMTTHFALIPIGKLKPGVLRLQMIELPPLDPEFEAKFRATSVQRLVSGSTTYGVK